MRLVVKQKGCDDKEFQFATGPVKIGRRGSNDVTLPDRSISKHHALIFIDDDEKWMVKDMGSANKTYLNGNTIKQAEIKTGDSLRISDFTIEISLDDSTEASAEPAPEPAAETGVDADGAYEGSITPTFSSSGPQIVVRKPGAVQAPPIRFPAKRAKEFMLITRAISRVENLDKLLLELLNIVSKQCDAFRAWCALRTDPDGPMTCHAGRHRNGQTIELDDIELKDKVNEAIEKNQFLLFLFSRIPGQKKGEGTRSVLIAPITNPAGCFGVIYIDNAIGDEHYSLSDLDYLMMIAIHTAAILEKH